MILRHFIRNIMIFRHFDSFAEIETLLAVFLVVLVSLTVVINGGFCH